MSDSLDSLRPIDHSGLSVNQAAIIALLLLAFIFNTPILVVLVAAAMLIGSAIGLPGFGFLYTGILKPLRWVKADIYPDNPEPHRFAQGFGGVVTAASAAALWSGASMAGWILAGVVVVLAALNLLIGFCAGCAVYYCLNRLRVPGFVKAAPTGTFPGQRPKRKIQ